MAELKLFNRWDAAGIEVQDAGLKSYITLNPIVVPKTGAKYAGNRFHKSRISVVERLINKVMIPGHKGKKHFKTSYHATGKAHTAASIVEKALGTIEARTKKNPIAVFVKAIENAAQREEILTIEYGGARYPKAVDCAPQRRIDLALRNMTQGAYLKSFNSKRSIVDALADEIIAASELSQNSNAISKKLDTERQADSAR
ncbi:TPA: 30S ribosomal protein S7 [Candidatus Woesearchaeota archaeon]|nr:30S ribosomal protein S7 [Candidatus Woesearchaeota archaeon]HII68342.1 30S ribosomal protein S7 [Candidatus Woesearchaeota archaeon]